MPESILPSGMVGLLAAFEPCFHAPTYRIFRLVLAGWSHRRTVWIEYVLMVSWGIVAVIYKWRGEVGHVVVLALGAVVYSGLIAVVRRVERRKGRPRELRNVG